MGMATLEPSPLRKHDAPMLERAGRHISTLKGICVAAGSLIALTATVVGFCYLVATKTYVDDAMAASNKAQEIKLVPITAKQDDHEARLRATEKLTYELAQGSKDVKDDIKEIKDGIRSLRESRDRRR